MFSVTWGVYVCGGWEVGAVVVVGGWFEPSGPRNYEENKSQARQGWVRIPGLSLSITEIELLPLCRHKRPVL